MSAFTHALHNTAQNAQPLVCIILKIMFDRGLRQTFSIRFYKHQLISSDGVYEINTIGSPQCVIYIKKIIPVDRY